MSEEIKHAAVKTECGLIMLAKSHAECIWKARNCGLEPSHKASDQGFFTSKGRFVERLEAANIAVAANQVAECIKYLFSEDLWSEQAGGHYDYDYVKGYVFK